MMEEIKLNRNSQKSKHILIFHFFACVLLLFTFIGGIGVFDGTVKLKLVTFEYGL